MNRMFVMVAATTGAAALAAVPAVLGLVGNPSFSHQLPVRVPSQAAHLIDRHNAPQPADDHAATVPTVPAVPTPSNTPTDIPGRDDRGTDQRGTDDHAGSAVHHTEPGDDRGGTVRHSEPGDDRGGTVRHSEPGDDRGRHQGAASTTHTEPGDDRGGQRSNGSSATTGGGDDDSGSGHGGHGRHGDG